MLKHTKEKIELDKKVLKYLNDNLIDWYRQKNIPENIYIKCANQYCRTKWTAKYSLKDEAIDIWYCYECIHEAIENICDK